jgi:hypothetical protein
MRFMPCEPRRRPIGGVSGAGWNAQAQTGDRF